MMESKHVNYWNWWRLGISNNKTLGKQETTDQLGLNYRITILWSVPVTGVEVVHVMFLSMALKCNGKQDIIFSG